MSLLRRRQGKQSITITKISPHSHSFQSPWLPHSPFFSFCLQPDYEQIAKYGGYTKGSAQVLYRKALRKLTDAWPVQGDAGSSASASGPENAGTDPATPSGKAQTPKTPRSRANTGKKRKDVAGGAGGVEDQDITPSGNPQTPFTPGAEGFHEDAMAMETPTKKPKKAPAKQPIS